ARETILYAGKFKSDDWEDVEARTEVLLKKFNIAKIGDNQMKKLSGGERKRVMVAAGLITNANILFLDEPTSGLDSTTSKMLIEMLKKLAKEENKMIVLTIHQPSQEIFEMFDDLVMLVQGEAIYSGPVKDIESTLSKYNLEMEAGKNTADYLISLVSSNDELYEENKLNSNVTKMIADCTSNEVVGEKVKLNAYYVNYMPKLSHMYLILKRNYVLNMRNKWGIIKPLLIGLIFLLLVNFVLMISINQFIKYLYDEIEDIKRLSKNRLMNQNELLHKIRDFIGNYRLLAIMNIIIFAENIFYLSYDTAMRFIVNIKLLKNEMMLTYYSTTSCYITTLVITMLYNYLLPVIVYTICTRVYDIYPLSYFYSVFFGPIFVIPFAFVIGTLSDSSMLIRGLNLLGSMLIANSPYWAYVLRMIIFIDAIDFVKYATWVLLIILPNYPILLMDYLHKFYYCTFSDMEIYDYITTFLVSLGNPELAIPKPMFSNAIEGITIPEWMCLIMTCIGPVLSIILGILLLGRILRPAIRIQMGKKK
ncbi:ABC transporter G family member 3, partial [Astathelohania contejeani]